MKPGIHPTYHTKTTITCACGAVLETGSTVENLHTEICSQCHPFYTGKKKFIDTGGRVDRFKRMTEKSAATKATRKKAPRVKTEKAPVKTTKKTASSKK